MDAPGRAVHPILIAALALVAICGYLAGSHRVSTPVAAEDPPSSTRVLSNAGLLLEYPLQWRRGGTAPVALPLATPAVLQAGPGSSSGLLSGRLAAGEAGPLPASFLRTLHGTPHAEVVNLVSTQAYRYSGLRVPSYTGALDIYVIPGEGTQPRVIACFSPRRLTPASQQCERIVAAVTLTGPAAFNLTPEATYAGELASVIGSLDQERSRTRHAMASSSSAAAVGADASELASKMSTAASSLAALQPPQVAAQAGVALAQALRAAGSAYTALAQAARSESVGAYDAAREQVDASETAVDSALEAFTLLGYGPN